MSSGLTGTAALHCRHTFVGGIYLLPMTNNRTRKEHLSHASENKMAASHMVQIHVHFPRSKKWPTYHVAVPTGNTLALQRGIFNENSLKFSTFIRR